MIFYFSATGNSKYVAKRIAEASDEQYLSITECIQDGRSAFELHQDEILGIITPTYFLGIPTIVRDFLESVKISSPFRENHYTFSVVTYGSTTGQADSMIEEYFTDIPVAGKFSIRMPDTWTPVFDLSDDRKVENMNRQAEMEIGQVCNSIQEKAAGNFNRATLPRIAGKLWYPKYEKARQTKNFTVADTCIGCGICERTCPAKVITIRGGKPEWIKDKCILCLGCLHRCPKFAIQYGRNTYKHGQYLHPNISS